MKKIFLTKKIIKYFLKINYNNFGEEEIREGIKDVLYMLDNEKSSLIELFKEEYKESKCNECKNLILDILKY